MTQIVTGPDGVEHEFPDDTPDAVIKGVLRKTYGAPNGAPKPAVSTISAQDRLLPEVRALGSSATDAQIQTLLDTRNKDIADQQAKEGYIPQAKEALRAAGEGVAAIPDAVMAPGKLLGNLALNLSGQPGAPVDSIRQVYNAQLPPDPTFPGTRKWASAAGPAIVEAFAPELAPGVTTASLPSRVTRAATTTIGAVGGHDAGGAVGEAIGGDTGRKIGEGLGSVFGSVAMPPVVAVAERGLNRIFTDEGSPGRVQTFDKANVPLSMGGVGNKFAGTIEDSTAGIPFAGGPAYKARRAQYGALDQGLSDVANAVRPGGAPTGEINVSTVGQGVRDTAETANANARIAQNAQLDPIYEQAGRDLPIDQTIQLDQMDTVRRGSQPQYRAPVANEIANVNASRFDPENAPKIVDPALEAQLQMALGQAQRKLMSARSSAQAQAAQAQIDSVNEAIQSNRGQTLDQAIESRSKLGRRVEGQQPLDQVQTLKVKDAQTEAIARAAELAGVPRSEFDAANKEYGRIADQRDVFKTLADMKRKAAAGQLADTDTLNALNEHAPSPLAKVMADALELKTRGRNAGSRIPDPEAMTAKRVVDYWNTLSEEAKTLQAGPRGSASRDRMEALVSTAAADMRRPTRTIPTGGNTLGAPATLFQNPAILSALGSIAGTGYGGVGTLVGGLTPSVSAWALGQAFTNPNFVQRVVTPGAFVPERHLGRLLAGAVGAQR